MPGTCTNSQHARLQKSYELPDWGPNCLELLWNCHLNCQTVIINNNIYICIYIYIYIYIMINILLMIIIIVIVIITTINIMDIIVVIMSWISADCKEYSRNLAGKREALKQNSWGSGEGVVDPRPRARQDSR